MRSFLKIFFSVFVFIMGLKTPFASHKLEDQGIVGHFVKDSFQRYKFLIRWDQQVGTILPREVGHFIGGLIFKKSIMDHNESVDGWAKKEVDEWNKDAWRDFSQSPLIIHLWECFDGRPLHALFARELCKRIIDIDSKELTGSTFKREMMFHDNPSPLNPWQAHSSFNGFFEDSEMQENLGYHENYYNNDSESQPILHFMIDNGMESLFDYAVQCIQKPDVRALWPDHFDPLRDALYHAVLSSKPNFVLKLRMNNVAINQFCRMFARMLNNEAMLELLDPQ